MMRQCRVSHHTKCTRHGTQHVSSIWSSNQAPKKKQQFDAICRLLTWIYFNGNKKGSKNGATVTYKTIFFGGDIPLHRPYIGLIYMVGTSNLGSWSGHWLLNWWNTEFQNRNVSRHQELAFESRFQVAVSTTSMDKASPILPSGKLT